MNKRQFWTDLTRSEREAMANELGTTHESSRQVFMYGKKTSAIRARALAEYTGIGAHEFCPAFNANDVLAQHNNKAPAAI